MLDEKQSEQPWEDGLILFGDRKVMMNAKGGFDPVEVIKPTDKLEDETVRKVMHYAVDLSQQIARFLEHTQEDIGSLVGLLAQEYGASKGGKKGNMTFMTYDGLMKIQVQVAEHIDFGPQLQIAKELTDECLNEWAADSRPEIRAIVTRAFNTDKKGQINRSEIYMLLRLDIEDKRWQRGMDAIREAMRVVGSKTYTRFYRRATVDGAWEPVTIDLAKVAS